MLAETATPHTISGVPTSVVDVRPEGLIAVGMQQGAISIVGSSGEIHRIPASASAIRDLAFGPCGDQRDEGATPPQPLRHLDDRAQHHAQH
jgi:hypothetical protein